MKGRRAPELAAGRCKDIITKAREVHAEFLLRSTAELTPAERSEVMSDWQLGVSIFCAELEIKM
eukprot:330737-Alexandrium_andersonii.AAC.1